MSTKSNHYFVYVLRSEKDNQLYIGMTTDVHDRLAEHNKGNVASTKPRRPFSLIYSEEVGGRTEAREREKYLKSSAGRRYLELKLRLSLPNRG